MLFWLFSSMFLVLVSLFLTAVLIYYADKRSPRAGIILLAVSCFLFALSFIFWALACLKGYKAID